MPALSFPGFPKDSIQFLKELTLNNERDWFNENKKRYESNVREPALAFIEAMAPGLAKISKCFQADARKSGGSLMRIYRDTRFSPDKTPYKTNIGIQFRHEDGKDVHAPGFYFHIEPDGCFIGGGIWHPDNETLGKIRDAIVEDPAGWKKVSQNKKFKETFELHGESLKRPPRGYDAEHPYIDDLKRKDHIGIVKLKTKEVYSKDIVKIATDHFKAAKPYVMFLTKSIGLSF